MCPDGSPVGLPDGDLSFLFQDSSGSSISEADLEGEEPTCKAVEDFTRKFEEGSRKCLDVQLVAGACGCPRFLRAFGVPTPTADSKSKETKGEFQVEAETADGAARQTGNAEKAALAWFPRISASLSLFGSSMIIYDISRDKTKRGSVFHPLMLAMSVLDIFSSIAWGLGTIPIPESSGIYGSRGNEKTCKAQGFFTQLGYTGIFYNVSLSFYFLMVVRYGMKEFQIKKLRLWLHVPALVAGFALAFGGIPFYQNVGWGCYVAPPPLTEDYRDILIFAVVPICTAIIIATVNTVLVYWAVRKQMIAARKWQFGAAAKQQQQMGMAGETFQPRRPEKMPQTAIQKIERQTFWQALFYLGAFYVTWPILLAAQFSEVAQDSYAWLVVVSILGPLQGFLNFLVYARPRIQKGIKERRKLANNCNRRRRIPLQHRKIPLQHPLLVYRQGKTALPVLRRVIRAAQS
jgi:hypothetical protein